MSVATYLISRPGRPLHLAIPAYDSPSKSNLYPTAHCVSLCGSDRGQRWGFTGPWAEKWSECQRGGLCLHCEKALAALLAAADEAPTRVRGAR